MDLNDQSVLAISKIMNFETQHLSQDVQEASAQKHLQFHNNWQLPSAVEDQVI